MQRIVSTLLILALLMGLMATVVADEPEAVAGVVQGAPHPSGVVMDILGASDPFVEGFNENETWDSGGWTYAAEWFALQYVPTQDYTFTGAELVLGGGVTDVIFRLYDNVGGQPGNILSEGMFSQVSDYVWQGADLAPGVDVTVGTTYWFGFRPLNGSYLSASQSGTIVPHCWNFGSYWEGPGWSVIWMAKFFGVPSGGNPTMHVQDIMGLFRPDRLDVKVLVADEYGTPLGHVWVDTILNLPYGTWDRWRYTQLSGWARFWAPLWANGNYEICVDDLVLAGYDYAPGDNVYTCMDWDY